MEPTEQEKADRRQALLEAWYAASLKLVEAKQLIETEMRIRRELFQELWPEPKEGVNNFPLGNKYVLKGTYKLKRTLHEEEVETVRAPLAELGVGLDSLLKITPSLSVSAYKTLTAEQRAVMDRVVTTRPESPTLEIKKPSEKD